MLSAKCSGVGGTGVSPVTRECCLNCDLCDGDDGLDDVGGEIVDLVTYPNHPPIILIKRITVQTFQSYLSVVCPVIANLATRELGEAIPRRGTHSYDNRLLRPLPTRGLAMTKKKE